MKVTHEEVESAWSELKESVTKQHAAEDKPCMLCEFDDAIHNDGRLAWAMSDPISSVIVNIFPAEMQQWLNMNPDNMHYTMKILESLILLGLVMGRKQGMAEMFSDMKELNQGR